MPFSDPQPVAYDQSQNVSGQACTGYSLSAPTPAAGPPGTASGLFTEALTPAGCTTTLALTITPHAADLNGNPVTATFNPPTQTLSQASPNASFTMTSNYAGKIVVSCTHTEATASGTGGTGGTGTGTGTAGSGTSP